MRDCGACFSPFNPNLPSCPVCGTAVAPEVPLGQPDDSIQPRAVLPPSGSQLGRPAFPSPPPSFFATGGGTPPAPFASPVGPAAAPPSTAPIPPSSAVPTPRAGPLGSSLGNTALHAGPQAGPASRSRWTPAVAVDGVVSGQVITDYRNLNRWPITLALLIALGVLAVTVLLPIFFVVLVAVAFIFALQAAIMLMAGSGAGAMGTMIRGVTTMVGLCLRFVVFLLGGAVATTGGGRPPLTIDSTSFRVVDQSGTTHNCIALGRLPAGTVRAGDTLSVRGFVDWSRSLRVGRIVNQRTGTVIRPQKPGVYWLRVGCQVTLVLFALWAIVALV